MITALRSHLARHPFLPIQLLRQLYWMWRYDRGARAPIGHKLRCWLAGFKVESAAMYGFPRPDQGDYFDDYRATFRIRELNASLAFYQHKLMQRALLLAAGFPQTQTVAVLWGDRAVLDPFTGCAEPATLERVRALLLADGGRFIAKPEDGGRGSAVWLVEPHGGALRCRRGRREEPFPPRELVERLTLVERCIEQAEFWRALFPDTLNTVRVLTLWPVGGSPFIARACQRIGAAGTIPCDNASAGGISAEIELDTGRMGPGRRRRDAMVETFTDHPDSGARIDGASLPHWGTICATALRAAASMPMNTYVGWDIFVDRTERVVIGEASGSTGTGIYQVHRGLLADPAVRHFFEKSGIL
jgi:hypothetical protein